MKKKYSSNNSVDNPYARSIPRSSVSSGSSVVNHVPVVKNAPYVSDHKRVETFMKDLIEQVGGVYESKGMFGMVYRIPASRTRTLHAILVDIAYDRMPKFPHVTDTYVSHQRITGDIALKIEHSSQVLTMKNGKMFDLTTYNKERAKWVKEVNIMLDMPPSIVPAVYVAFTAGLLRVTAMEFIEGQPIDRVMRNPVVYGFDMSILKHLEKQVHSLLWLLWKRGYVHMDLHGNNVIVKPNGRLVVIDFGESTTLPKHLRPSTLRKVGWNAHAYWKKHLEPEINQYILGKKRNTYVANGRLISVLRKQRAEFDAETERLKQRRRELQKQRR